MKQILIATDGSPSAQEAVDVGLELAKEQDADVTFVHVTDPDEFRGGRGGTHAIAHTEEIDDSETVLKAAGEAAEEAGVSYALERISGNTVESIVAFADEKDADVIVVGSRGRNSLDHRAARQHLARRAPPRPPAGPRRQDREDARGDACLSPARYAAGGGDSAGPASPSGSVGPMSSRNGGYSSRMRPT